MYLFIIFIITTFVSTNNNNNCTAHSTHFTESAYQSTLVFLLNFCEKKNKNNLPKNRKMRSMGSLAKPVNSARNRFQQAATWGMALSTSRPSS